MWSVVLGVAATMGVITVAIICGIAAMVWLG
jgi:hypothetical protein